MQQPERGAGLIAFGIGLLAEGGLLGTIGVLGGETDNIPYGVDMLYGIDAGVYDYKFKNENKCNK